MDLGRGEWSAVAGRPILIEWLSCPNSAPRNDPPPPSIRATPSALARPRRPRTPLISQIGARKPLELAGCMRATPFPALSPRNCDVRDSVLPSAPDKAASWARGRGV
jgi:hypothetical protein